ncbi:hypothetical protein [Streptomyces sporangiiformans]|uniref:Uncharacterized protein n=1 Tax=Streptomyces sporangiiformans TaxID=2315329 RepID=A0A505DLQ3_9ACTN|nr:hypothetical protein [Streptomyces sporangiiformans]TPQ21346.1 hypothetical protein FGD71_015465 [Streptomyces sporangiiformans]
MQTAHWKSRRWCQAAGGTNGDLAPTGAGGVVAVGATGVLAITGGSLHALRHSRTGGTNS